MNGFVSGYLNLATKMKWAKEDRTLMPGTRIYPPHFTVLSFQENTCTEHISFLCVIVILIFHMVNCETVLILFSYIL